jgi:hypothetical protein
MRRPPYGLAATEIANETGGQVAGFSQITWVEFERLVGGLRLSPGVARRVHMLEKIAREPEAKKFTLHSRGGGPGQIFQSVENNVCRLQAGDVAVLMTYFLKHGGAARLTRSPLPELAISIVASANEQLGPCIRGGRTVAPEPWFDQVAPPVMLRSAASAAERWGFS